MKGICLLEDIVPVDCFAANFKIVLGKVGTNGFSKKAAVVSDQYSVGHPWPRELHREQTVAYALLSENRVLCVSSFQRPGRGVRSPYAQNLAIGDLC